MPKYGILKGEKKKGESIFTKQCFQCASAVYNLGVLEHFAQKVMHKDLIQFKNLYGYLVILAQKVVYEPLIQSKYLYEFWAQHVLITVEQ